MSDQLSQHGGESDGSERLIQPPEGFFKNPKCDLHGETIDMVTRSPEEDGGLAVIDLFPRENGLYEVALNAGIDPEYETLVVSRGRIQSAVELFAERSRDTET